MKNLSPIIEDKDLVTKEYADSSLSAHTSNTSNPHNVTKDQIGLSEVPNVPTNSQIVTYTVADENTNLSSGEVIHIAFSKIARAISSLITHLADSVSHITSTERNTWNSKANGTHSHDNATTSISGFMSGEDKIKLNGLNNYSLPIASNSVLGGIKVGTNLSIDASGVLSASGGGQSRVEITDIDVLFEGYLSTGTAATGTLSHNVSDYDFIILCCRDGQAPATFITGTIPVFAVVENRDTTGKTIIQCCFGTSNNRVVNLTETTANASYTTIKLYGYKLQTA